MIENFSARAETLKKSRAEFSPTSNFLLGGLTMKKFFALIYSDAADLRTGEETGNVQAVMDGEIDNFIRAFLAMKANVAV